MTAFRKPEAVRLCLAFMWPVFPVHRRICDPVCQPREKTFSKGLVFLAWFRADETRSK